MARVSSQLWQLVSWLEDTTTHPADRHNRVERRPGGSAGWLFGTIALLLLIMSNWRLVLATGVGLTTTAVIYIALQEGWTLPATWRQWWLPANRPVTLAIASGGVATLSSYLAIALWSEVHHPGLAMGILLQGAGMLAVFLILAWQALHQTANQTEAQLHTILQNLTEADPLQRLVAIRQATDWASKRQEGQSPISIHAYLADCFRLMLTRETDPVLRNALLDGLQSLNQPSQLSQGTAPLKPPLTPIKHPEHHPAEPFIERS